MVFLTKLLLEMHVWSDKLKRADMGNYNDKCLSSEQFVTEYINLITIIYRYNCKS